MRKMRVVMILALFLAAAPSLYCEGFQYESRGKRDPFVPLVGGSRPTVTKLEDITSVGDIKVEGIVVGAQGNRMAILNGDVFKEGDKAGEVEIKKIESISVVIMIGGKSYELYLPGEEGGKKGEK